MARASGWIGCFTASSLRGLSLTLTTPLTFLLESSEPHRPSAARDALRLLAGVEVPSAGAAYVEGVEPTVDPALRRSIALLGDPALVPPASELAMLWPSLAKVRGVDPSLGAKEIARAASSEEGRVELGDRLANAEAAKLLLVSHPEALPSARRETIHRVVDAALARGARVVVATRTLDEWLALGHSVPATAAVIADGRIVAAGEAHAIAWAVPLEGEGARWIEIELDDDPPEPEATPTDGLAATGADASSPSSPSLHRATPAARLASALLAEPAIYASIVAIEPSGRCALAVRTRDPRSVARAIARQARSGLAVARLRVVGASSALLARSLGGARTAGSGR
jgi:hypothetical protein